MRRSGRNLTASILVIFIGPAACAAARAVTAMAVPECWRNCLRLVILLDTDSKTRSPRAPHVHGQPHRGAGLLDRHPFIKRLNFAGSCGDFNMNDAVVCLGG